MLNKFNNLIQKTMKKIITLLAVVAFVVSCSQSRKWTDKEREEVRKTLRDYRDRSAIRHMEAANYSNLEQCVLTTIEGTYPDYNKYDQLTVSRSAIISRICRCCFRRPSCNRPVSCPQARPTNRSRPFILAWPER